MYNLLGLSGNPFGGGFDRRLYWEGRERRELLEAGARLLREKQNVWVRGEAGSGKGWFMRRLVGEAASKAPVLFAEGALPGETLPFLQSLLGVISPGEVPQTLHAAAEKLYTRLLRRFWQGGTIMVVPGTAPLRGEGALGEVQHLSSARVKGKPLCGFVLCGETSPPFPGFGVLDLPQFTPEELSECIRLRAGGFGARDVIPQAEREAICSGARGIGNAMELASACLHRLLFDRREAAGASAAVRPVEGEEEKKPVLPKDQLTEISRLLDAISSGKPST